MSESRDLIEEYLTELRGRLELAAEEADLVVAEAEDHLRETEACGLATGITQHEAQQAAISAFGSITAVVRAHASRPDGFIRGRTPAAILGDLILAGWKLGATGLIAVGISGLLVQIMNYTLGRAFTGQAPAGVAFEKVSCAYWMSQWPGAHTCATAHLLEASSDAVVLRIAAGALGAALFAGYVLVRYVQRRYRMGPAVVLAGYFPLLAATAFGTAALGMALAQLTGFAITQGPGTYLSGTLVAAAAAAWYGRRAGPAIRHLRREWENASHHA
jgi:hypothetical protein